MMREFKFRVWSDETKMMYHSHRPNGTNNPMWSYDSVFRANNPKTHIMQYTGIKDKNGKEIYESDIIQIKDRFVMWSRSRGQIVEDVNAIVVWSGDGFIPQRSANTRLWILDMAQYEVIGNIYENPEMIDKI